MKKNFYKDILETIREPLCVVDSSETILYRNPAFDQHFQIDESADFHAFSQLPEKYTSISLIRECIRDKKSETRVLQEGTDATLEVSVTRLAEDPGEADCYIEQILAFPAKASDRPQTSRSSLSFDELVISDRAMADINQTISRIAYFDSTILIQGESGTGKTALARHIHKNSNRAQKPFVTINCGSIPESLIESELFGYASGAFTSASKKGKPGQVELADGGTLFLDEIGILSLDVQAMLLRVLQEGTYIPIGGNKEKRANVRIVAATNEDLQLAIQEKRFREDLYHRLCEFEIVLPSLHECPDDILSLAHHFRKKFSGELKRPTEGFSSEAEQLLLSYRWPGNVRELHNRIRRAVLMAKQPLIETADLNIKLEAATEEINLFPENDAEEKHSIIQALKTSHGSRKQAAGILHIDPSTLYRKMKKYGLNDK